MSNIHSSLTANQPAGLTYDDEVLANRKPDYPVHPLILNRWSPRAYANIPVSDEVLFTVLEAARWAPSGGNQQPWRFYVARTAEERETFLSFILPRNQLWTRNAPVLLLIASRKFRDSGEPLNTHAFDAGAAWATLALQARLLGLSTRAVGGFDQELARKTLQVPESIALHAVIALGYRGRLDKLDPSFHELEQPNGRRPIADSLLPIAPPPGHRP
ncbi:nitroreductase family protein [Paenibacillus thermoaerophilus]|uniref:Nitroreductase family protein n=1 Tax=Paenibacillus thermoaerophilus TaxID=1215385 RepID=A0ABW2V0N2_9BACL|nr:nitroreductase family protein [Paenibacillus thermoaerophilus]TMV09419.1 nitroreductase [Paenibacillus thermoaerophilus]